MTIGDNETIEVARDWNFKAAVEDTNRFMKGLNFPQMRKPEGLGEDYTYPSDVRNLTGIDLGSLSLKLTGWYTFCLGEIGREESELIGYQTIYDTRLGIKAHEQKAQRADAKGVIPFSILSSLAIRADPILEAMTKELTQRKMRIRRLESQAKIYEEQLAKLSREQSRREAESRH